MSHYAAAQEFQFRHPGSRAIFLSGDRLTHDFGLQRYLGQDRGPFP